jgi:predicted  nucleic acid-binding Zn-ribbon protein
MEGQVRELEEQIRDHNRSSSLQNGRINVSHARKKRRLDMELEKLFDSIEAKRSKMSELDENIAEKSRMRDDKESQMADLEQKLVQFLVEQMRTVLAMVEEYKSIEDRGKAIANENQMKWTL